MFGYVRVLEPELKVREYTLYRGVYCGLCHTMKKKTCRSSTLSLSYDFTFLAFFRAAMTDEPFTITKKRCGIHPFKKRPVAECNNALDYCAGASAVLKYYKLLDDLQDKDKKGFKKLIIRLLLPSAKRHLKAAVRSFPQYELEALSQKVSETLNALSLLETANTASTDACADAFGKTLAIVFSHSIENADQKEVAERIGYHIGKWIYFADAINDFDDDIRTGNFNPLIAAGYSPLPCSLLDECLTMELGAAYEAVKQIDFKYLDIKSIILNIITLGMPARAKNIFAKYTEPEAPSVK